MRIARVMTRMNLGGPARQALASDPLLRRRGHTVRLFTGTPESGEGDLFDAAVAAGLDVVRVPGMARGVAPARDLRAGRALKRMLEEFEPDVVHTHASKAGTLGRRAVRRAEAVGRVHTFHGHVLEGYFPAALSRTLVMHERRLAGWSDRIIAVSHATAEDLLRLQVVDESRLVVVPPGIELNDLLAIERRVPRGERQPAQPGSPRDRIGARPEDVLIGVVGRLADVKRPELAIEVFERLTQRYPRLHVVFVGDGEGRGALERRILGMPANHAVRVHMLGAVEHMGPVWQDLDGVLLTSRSEGLPVAIIEAAAAGLPAVAMAVGGVPEIVVHERTGYLGESVDELCFGLGQLLENPGDARAMGERARLRAKSRHSADRLADRLEDIYRAVREERRCAS